LEERGPELGAVVGQHRRWWSIGCHPVVQKGCCELLLSYLKRCLHGPHPPARGRPQRGEGAVDRHPTGCQQRGTRRHPPGASNKAKARRPSGCRGPPAPLRRHRVKHQHEAGSSSSESARRITPQPQRGTARPTTAGTQSSQSDAARGPTVPPRPVIGHLQGPPSRRPRG